MVVDIWQMRIGIFGDAHDHLDHVVQAVTLFKAIGYEMDLYAEELLLTINVHKLKTMK